MQIKQLFIIAAAALIGLASCSKDESGSGLSLSVDPANLDVQKEGGDFSLAVTANCEWQAKSTVAWATIDKTSGNGNGTIKVTVSKNYNEEPAEQTQAREGEITFTFGNEAKPVKVYQYGEATVFGVEIAAGSSLVQGEDGGAILFTVTASDKNYTVTLSEGADKWITRATPKSAYEFAEVFTVAKNSGAERTATITFTMPGVLGPKEFTIQQEAGAPSDPTKITTAGQFLAMLARPQSETCDTVYTIMNDIDFTGVTITPENNFKGNFYATLDGNGKKFTNYTATSDMIQHLFGTMKNLTIESGTFTLEPDHSGGIFCEQIKLGGVAENLINKATISGDISTTDTFHQGALCGICRGTMTGCENHGNATINLTQAAKKHYRFGGICASCTPEDATGKICVQNCKNTGSFNIFCSSVKANVYLGGLFGVADSKGCDFLVNNCSNSGKLSVTNASGYTSTSAVSYVGGLAGQRNAGAITNCTNTGEIDVTELNFDKVYVGGIVAFQKAGYTDECFQGCKVNAKVKASFLKSDATGANTLANAGMVLGLAGDAGVTFGSSTSPIVVGGSLYAGTTEIKVTSDNALELALGAANTAKPTFNLAIKNIVDGSIAPIIYPFPRP